PSPPTPRSPPCPYTTLFRSPGAAVERLIIDRAAKINRDDVTRRSGCVLVFDRDQLRLRFAQLLQNLVYFFRLYFRLPALDADRPDRKSTRLNSSHVKTSYAV